MFYDSEAVEVNSFPPETHPRGQDHKIPGINGTAASRIVVLVFLPFSIPIKYDQTIGDARRSVAMKLHGVLPVDMVDSLEVGEKCAEGLPDLLSPLERR